MADYLVNEQTAFQIQQTLKRETGVPVPAADLTALMLTLYDAKTGAVVNSRTASDVKNANGGTVHATSGLFTMTFAPADMALITATESEEHHVAIFEAAWSGGGAKWQDNLWVRNLALTATVAPALLDSALLTMAEARIAIGADAAVGTALAAVINTVSALLERETGRRLKSRVYTALRYQVRRDDISPDGTQWFGLEWPITAVVSVTVNQTAQTMWMPGDAGEPTAKDVYVLDGPSPDFARDRLYRPAGWAAGDAVVVTHTGGYVTIPHDLKEGAKTLCRERWLAEQRQMEPATAVTLDGQSVAVDGYRLLLRVRDLIRPYRRWAA